MGFLDKAKDLAGKHDDKVDQGIARAGDEVDKRVDDQHDDKIQKGVDAAQQRTGAGDTDR